MVACLVARSRLVGDLVVRDLTDVGFPVDHVVGGEGVGLEHGRFVERLVVAHEGGPAQGAETASSALRGHHGAVGVERSGQYAIVEDLAAPGVGQHQAPLESHAVLPADFPQTFGTSEHLHLARGQLEVAVLLGVAHRPDVIAHADEGDRLQRSVGQ